MSKKDKETKDKDSGIGLSNIRRRLELLYPENHSLTITHEDNWYVIELAIFNDECVMSNG